MKTLLEDKILSSSTPSARPKFRKEIRQKSRGRDSVKMKSVRFMAIIAALALVICMLVYYIRNPLGFKLGNELSLTTMNPQFKRLRLPEVQVTLKYRQNSLFTNPDLELKSNNI